MNKRAAGAKLPLTGKFHIQVLRQGEVVDEFDVKNGIVNEGMNKLLDVMFGGDTPIDPWYIGLISSTTPTLNAADTLASHTWTEITDYDEGARVEWDDDAAAARAKTNTTPADFTINATVTVRGIFIASVASGTSGILWSTALFGSNVALLDNDVLRCTYSLSG